MHFYQEFGMIQELGRVLVESQTCLVFQSQLTQLAKFAGVRFWIGLIRLFIDWLQHCEEPYYGPRTPQWAKNGT